LLTTRNEDGVFVVREARRREGGREGGAVEWRDGRTFWYVCQQASKSMIILKTNENVELYRGGGGELEKRGRIVGVEIKVNVKHARKNERTRIEKKGNNVVGFLDRNDTEE